MAEQIARRPVDGFHGLGLMKGLSMIVRTAFAVATVTTFVALTSVASAAPRQGNMSGQSAAAGTAFDADRREEAAYRRQPMYGDSNVMGMRPGSMTEDGMMDRAARPDRQR